MQEISKILDSLLGLCSPSVVLMPRWQHRCHQHPCRDGWGVPRLCQTIPLSQGLTTCHQFGKRKSSWELPEEQQRPIPMVEWAKSRAWSPRAPVSVFPSQVRARATPGCTHQSSLTVPGRCCAGPTPFSRAVEEQSGDRRFCPRERLISSKEKRNLFFFWKKERREITAARVVKSLDKIFNMEKKTTFADC